MWRESHPIERAGDLRHLYHARAHLGRNSTMLPRRPAFPGASGTGSRKRPSPGARMSSGGWISSSSIRPRCFSPARGGESLGPYGKRTDRRNDSRQWTACIGIRSWTHTAVETGPPGGGVSRVPGSVRGSAPESPACWRGEGRGRARDSEDPLTGGAGALAPPAGWPADGEA